MKFNQKNLIKWFKSGLMVWAIVLVYGWILGFLSGFYAIPQFVTATIPSLTAESIFGTLLGIEVFGLGYDWLSGIIKL